MTTRRFRVGPRPVEGVEPGEVLELPLDTPLNVSALVESGHLTPIRATTRPSTGEKKEER
ncbi:hypothetical protein [Amycolatopsis suaedae]|uniref:Uncharacterized protein n=1 Tax=Amycolatopsis suaedae TaxID=2510978 RepID=A0A4V2EL00_9PSEU|nr:hypothetical protein [Amycolatopsis suaedae]RZQ59835.1 hypothetical protein EWH70_32495 [Amycolatopsis suaedae]